MKYVSTSPEETKAIASQCASSFSPAVGKATVVGLYGDLGAGKTAFTQGVAAALGVEGSLVSPTFVIEKIYRLSGVKDGPLHHVFQNLIHIDAYRLEKSEELVSLGWKTIISDPQNLILVEWPEKIRDIMPEHIKIYFKHTESENSREIEILQ